MTEWTRQDRPGLCGLCGELLETGAAIYVIRTERWRKIRGECCAGPAPPDLPALPAPRQAFTRPMTSAARGVQALARQAGWVK